MNRFAVKYKCLRWNGYTGRVKSVSRPWVDDDNGKQDREEYVFQLKIPSVQIYPRKIVLVYNVGALTDRLRRRRFPRL